VKEEAMDEFVIVCADPRRSIKMSLRTMMTTSHLGAAAVHPAITSAARELLKMSENERSGVLSTAMSFLDLYRAFVMARVTRRCDWRIADLIAGDRRAALQSVPSPERDSVPSHKRQRRVATGSAMLAQSGRGGPHTRRPGAKPGNESVVAADRRGARASSYAARTAARARW
jgi:hypothetical protein